MDLKKCRVLVTPTSYGMYDPFLKSDLENQVGSVTYNTTGKPLSSELLKQLLPGVDGYIAGLDEINENALQKADCLKVIARYGVGLDNVDLFAAKQKGIVVTNTPGANSASVAELTLSLMLALARKIFDANLAVRNGEWPRYAGTSLEGKTVGLIGLGAIGKEVARRLAGFGCRIIACDPYIDNQSSLSNTIDFVEFEDLIKISDFISLHIPLLPETTNLIQKNVLVKMKKGAYLINTSRGEVVNESDLFEVLQSGWLNGAALDAFCEEPPPRDNPLLTLPNVITTPHLGAHTDGATSSMGWMALRDCLAVLNGDEPLYRVS